MKDLRTPPCVQVQDTKKDEDNVSKFQVRVSKKEKSFLDYARSHHLNYNELMEG